MTLSTLSQDRTNDVVEKSMYWTKRKIASDLPPSWRVVDGHIGCMDAVWATVFEDIVSTSNARELSDGVYHNFGKPNEFYMVNFANFSTPHTTHLARYQSA